MVQYWINFAGCNAILVFMMLGKESNDFLLIECMCSIVYVRYRIRSMYKCVYKWYSLSISFLFFAIIYYDLLLYGQVKYRYRIFYVRWFLVEYVWTAKPHVFGMYIQKICEIVNVLQTELCRMKRSIKLIIFKLFFFSSVVHQFIFFW